MNPRAHGLCCAGILLLSCTGLQAQSTANTAQSTRSTFSALNRIDALTPTDRFAQPSPADADLGEQLLLTRDQRHRAISLSGSYATTWTSNAFYTPSSPSSDVIMSLAADALYMPHLGNNYFFEAGASLDAFRYFRNPVLDFNSLETTVGFLKVFNELADIGLYGRYEYRLLFDRNGNDILQEHSLVAGLRKTFQFSRGNALFLSAEADFSLGGEPSYALAHEFSFFVGHHQIDWSRWVNTSLFYQMAVYDFLEGGRADLQNYLGVGVGFRPLKWVTVAGTGWLGWNSSNESQYNFFVANLGGALSATINF